jgi:hypothetical protein
LISKGIVPRKTYIDSDVFYHVPDELLRHFIRGNMDGDGCICRFIKYGKIKYRVNFLGRMKFIKELEAIFKKKFPEDLFYSVQYQSLWRSSICYAPTILRILNWLYSDATVYLERKHDKYLGFKNEFSQITAHATGRNANRDNAVIIAKAWRTRKAKTA